VITDIEAANALRTQRRLRDWRREWGSELAILLGLVAVGALVALVWRLLTPYAADLGDEQEASAAVDGTLALVGLAIGTVIGVLVLIRPGRVPVARTLAAIYGSLVGAEVSWLLGDQFGTPALRALGAVYTWPVATAGVLFLGALLPWTSSRLQRPPFPPSPGDHPTPF
jgi:hypothetical protein